MMRLLSCFGAGKLRHLSYESGGDRGFWSRKETVKKIQRVAKGGASKRYLPLDTQPVERWVTEQTSGAAFDQNTSTTAGSTHASHERIPVIALETAAHASNLCDFKFPQKCDIMVGAEDAGISSAVIDAMDQSSIVVHRDHREAMLSELIQECDRVAAIFFAETLKQHFFRSV